MGLQMPCIATSILVSLALAACGDDDREGSVESSGTETTATDTSATTTAPAKATGAPVAT